MVMARDTGPETPTHECPAESPYLFPEGPVAPVSLKPQVVSSVSLIVLAFKEAYSSVDALKPSICPSVTFNKPFWATRV